MCRNVRTIECCANCSLTYPDAIVISVYIICATIIIYKLMSSMYDSIYIINSKQVRDKFLFAISLSIILVLLIVLILIFGIIKI